MYSRMGRPPKYSTPEDMEAKIDEYFAQTATPNMAALVIYLGFAHRQSLTDYLQNKPEFTDTIKRARCLMESNYVNRLLSEHKMTGALAFTLKCNYDWTEKVVIDGGDVTINVNNKSYPKREDDDGEKDM
jgi:hypothetical protein